MKRFLLDTQTIIWTAEGNPSLSNIAKRTILSPDSELIISVASIWEMSIKMSLGKLRIPCSLENLINRQLSLNSMEELNITKQHTLAVLNLPFHHRDPFDRVLISQAQVEGLIIITSDKVFKKYQVNVLW